MRSDFFFEHYQNIRDALKSRRMQRKLFGDTHRSASNTHGDIYATHASTTPESITDTTGDSPNIQPLPPEAPGSRVILVKINGCCVLHVLNVSIVTQNLGKSQPPEKS